ncbi:MAG: pyruvate formate lyase family protein [Planctomycetota bacterium]|jgi:formate C-acetyltransferase
MTSATGELKDQGPERLAVSSFGVVTPFKGAKRLSPATRTLAARYLSGEIGRSLEHAGFSVPDSFLAGSPTDNQYYAEAVRLIAESAPLRILPGERLVGAATLREAAEHRTPLTPFGSISHTTIGFEKALKIGTRGLRMEIQDRLKRGDLDEAGVDLLKAMLVCLDAAGRWHARHIGTLEELQGKGDSGAEMVHYEGVLKNLRNVPEHPPENFREAVQALWLLWSFQRLCGNWSGIGRIDKMLGPFLSQDLASGRITLDEAREFLAHFWIKGCEWTNGTGHSLSGEANSGDAQYYQNIVLGGVDEDGRPVANEVTELVLDVVEELHISDFPIAVRIGKGTPNQMLKRIAEIQRLGGGIIAVYNDDRIIPSLVAFGYDLKEARNFANDGCWEVLIPGKTSFGYQPFDALLLLQEALGLSTEKPEVRHQKVECDEWQRHSTEPGQATPYPDFEALYQAFHRRLTTTVDALLDTIPFNDTPCPLLSLMVDGCIESGRSYTQGGPVYTVLSPHASGLPDVANSLTVIKRLVFENEEMPLEAFVEILQSDWDGQEVLRRRIQEQFDFYGNDAPESDAMLKRVYNDFTTLVGACRERHGVLRPAGISTFGREMSAYLPHRTATASGQRRGAYLAANFSPTPGTDKAGPTAVIRSHCSVDLGRLPCGTALDLKIAPQSVAGETGLHALTGLMRTFVELGGFFMQTDVIDTALLRRAQEDPDAYPNLAVRISGWSARFATLSREWQDLIINRTEQ